MREDVMKDTCLLPLMMLMMLLLLPGCAFVNIPLFSTPSPFEEQVLEGEGSKKILLMDISGTISEQEKTAGLMGTRSSSMVSQVREALQKAEKDKQIAA